MRREKIVILRGKLVSSLKIQTTKAKKKTNNNNRKMCIRLQKDHARTLKEFGGLWKH